MATLYYDLKLPDSSNSNIDISTFIAPCTNKSSAWWDSLSVFDHQAKTLKDWLATVTKRNPDWMNSSPYTMRVCPGVGDLFKRSYLVKWPCDALFNVVNKDGKYLYNYKTSDGSVPSLINFDYHHEDQYRNTKHQIYNNMFNIKLCLPVIMFSNKIVTAITVNPDYHLSEIPYKVMPGILDYTSSTIQELNINVMFPIPSYNSEYTLEFKAGNPICYLTLMNFNRTVDLQPKESRRTYRRKFLRGLGTDHV